MKPVIYLGFHMVLFAEGLKDFYGSSSGTQSFYSGTQTNSYSSFLTPLGSTNNYPCDWIKIVGRASDAHEACHKECFYVKTSIYLYYKLYPDFKTLKFLYYRCGAINAGKCAYHYKDPNFPICWCHAANVLKNDIRTPLSICRVCFKLARIIADMENAMDTGTSVGLATGSSGTTNSPDSRVNKTGENKMREEAEEEDDEPEGSVLVTDLEVSGIKMRAILTTGSGVTVISPECAGNFRRLDRPRSISGVNNEGIAIRGKTTLYAQVGSGIILPITGLVAEIKYDILLGNDFFVKYAAKINIPERVMEVSIGQTKVEIFLEFREPFIPGPSLLSHSDSESYTSLEITVKVNNRKTNIAIDTGSAYCIVREDFANPKKKFPISMQGLSADSTTVEFTAQTFCEILIEKDIFKAMALLPKFNFSNRLIMGNSVNKYWVEIIDFEQNLVTFKLPDKNKRVITRAFIRNTPLT